MLTANVSAQEHDYPNKPITIVVPYGAGSSTDILTRALAQNISQQLAQTVIVENRAGAGGAVGSSFVAKAAPDGYMLVMGTISSHSINQTMIDDLPYDVLEDFEPVSLVAHYPNILAANIDFPANNLAELVTLAKERGRVSVATGGIGSSGQMAAELLRLHTGAPLEHVPYKEAGQAITDTIGGHVPMLIYQAPALTSQINSGNLKALAVLAPQRTPLLPELQTADEQGIADFDATAWMGLFAPRNTPVAVIDRLNSAIKNATQDEELNEQIKPLGFTMVGDATDEFKEFVKRDIEKWAQVIETTGAVN